MLRPRVSQCDTMFKVVNANKDDCIVCMFRNIRIELGVNLKLRAERHKVSSSKSRFNQLCNGQVKMQVT